MSFFLKKIYYECMNSHCQKKHKLLVKMMKTVLKNMINIILMYFLNKSFSEIEIYTNLHYFVFSFYQINKNNEIWTRDRLIIKILANTILKNYFNSIIYIYIYYEFRTNIDVVRIYTQMKCYGVIYYMFGVWDNLSFIHF